MRIRPQAPPTTLTTEEAAGVLADVLLARAAYRSRLERGPTADPLAGLRIDDEEVDRLLTTVGADRAGGGGVKTDALDRAIEQAHAAFAGTLAGSPTLLPAIVRTAGLDERAAETLGFLAAVELEPVRQRLLAYVQDDVTKTRPTLATVRALLGPDAVLALAPAGALRRSALVSVDEAGPWAAQPVTLCSPVTWALAGDESADPDLPFDAVTRTEPVDPGGATLVLVTGQDRARRLAAAFTAARGHRFLVTPLPTSRAAWEAVIREATVAGLAVVVELEGDLPAEARWWIERAGHLAWAISSVAELPLEDLPDRPWVEQRVDDGEVTPEEWQAVLGDTDRRGHRLTTEQLRLAARALPGVGGSLDDAVRRLASGHLDKHARRIRPRRRWDDLVLAEDRLAQLKELTSRYQHRDVVHGDWGFPAYPSSGLVALFSGSSGTGKTLAAEIIAGELGLDLYKVDISMVVSKYIGETEQNLEKVFDAASAGNLVLFFDEADSLFGKRSEVSDARDRYANLEVSYLLQRLEAYDGLVVMATNFQRNIDEAFIRRIHVSVEFPKPEEEERRRIWQQAFPASAPVDDLDWDFLARQFKINGGPIKNAALHAAFLAADSGTTITMETVMLGLKREFQKLGRLRTESEFGPYAALVSG